MEAEAEHDGSEAGECGGTAQKKNKERRGRKNVVTYFDSKEQNVTELNLSRMVE